MTTLTHIEAKPATPSTEWNPTLVLLISLGATSFASIFMKLAQNAGLPSPIIAAGRLILASLAMTPLVIRNYSAELRSLSRRDILFAVIAGVLLAAHFMSIVYSLENTSIMLLIVILNTGPLWTALLEKSFLKTRLNRTIWLGLLITIGGGITIAFFNSGAAESTSDNVSLGIGLAVFSSIAGSANLVIGRSVRAKMSMLPYSWIVFGIGGLTALAFVFATSTPILGHPTMGYFWLVLLTVIPQIVGHSGFNYVVRYFSATFLSIAGQSLTITMSIAAFFIFGEVPGMGDIIGSAIILIGMVLAIIGSSQKSTSTS